MPAPTPRFRDGTRYSRHSLLRVSGAVLAAPRTLRPKRRRRVAARLRALRPAGRGHNRSRRYIAACFQRQRALFRSLRSRRRRSRCRMLPGRSFPGVVAVLPHRMTDGCSGRLLPQPGPRLKLERVGSGWPSRCRRLRALLSARLHARGCKVREERAGERAKIRGELASRRTLGSSTDLPGCLRWVRVRIN